MNALYAMTAAILVLAGAPTTAADSEAVGPAQVAAKSWLALADSAEYGRSWDAASAFFKSAITRDAWEKALQGVRSTLGAIKSRKVESATFTRDLPGAPDGEYVVIRFQSRFEDKDTAVETVTPMLEKDGTWKVSGYFIK